MEDPPSYRYSRSSPSLEALPEPALWHMYACLKVEAPSKFHSSRPDRTFEIFRTRTGNTIILSTMLRPLLPRTRHGLRAFRRSLHSVPMLNSAFNDGVPGLLSPAGFDIAWTQYQSLMVDKLNNLVAGMSKSLPATSNIPRQALGDWSSSEDSCKTQFWEILLTDHFRRGI